MSTFFGKMRAGAGKAAFEADKLRRVALIQNELRSLRGNLARALGETGEVAHALYRRGEVTQPELVAACAAVAAAMAAIDAHEAEIERIRDEQYVDPQAPVEPVLVCPTGHGVLPPGARFCQQCGLVGIEAPPAPAAPPTPDAAPWSSAAPYVPPATPAAPRCPDCGHTLGKASRFCTNCGRPTSAAPPLDAGRSPGPAPLPPSEHDRSGGLSPLPNPTAPSPSGPAPATAHCPSCGASLQRPLPAYCNICGFSLKGI